MRQILILLTAAMLMLGSGCSTPVSTRTSPATNIPIPPYKSFSAYQPDPLLRANADMMRDFLDLSFNLETGARLERFSRVEGPVSLRVKGNSSAHFQKELSSLLNRLRTEAGIEITPTTDPNATITIVLIPKRQLHAMQPRAACFVVPNVDDVSQLRRFWRPAGTDWRQITVRNKLALFIPQDEAPQEVRDCLHEELAQALGPLNDLYRLPDSIFNDDNVHTVLTSFDMLMLRVTYDPSLQSGMSRDEVAKRLPEIFARLNPRGQKLRPTPVQRTTRAWVQDLNTAIGPGSSSNNRRERGAFAALQEATTQGWRDHRYAFSSYLAGRAALGQNDLTARTLITNADRVYASSPLYRLPRARTLGQLATLDLESGEPEAAIARLDPAIETARHYQNATLLTELMVLKSEALLELGKSREAGALRLDTLGWASYGFGKDWANFANVQIIPSPTSQIASE